MFIFSALDNELRYMEVLPFFTRESQCLTQCVGNSFEWMNQSQRMGSKKACCMWNEIVECRSAPRKDLWKSVLVARTLGDLCALINWTFKSLFSCTVYSIYRCNYRICMYKWMQLQSPKFFFFIRSTKFESANRFKSRIALSANDKHSQASCTWER